MEAIIELGRVPSPLESRFQIQNNLDKPVKWAEINIAKFSNNIYELLQETQVHTYNMGNKCSGGYTAKRDLGYTRTEN